MKDTCEAIGERPWSKRLKGPKAKGRRPKQWAMVHVDLLHFVNSIVFSKSPPSFHIIVSEQLEKEK
ncbi:hypothetical protein CFP56_003371 [Quercus suber]|uniref:Uncharacterized protein n=1 Tax=Quercus suber TaxID=58331 RepID=A0AAW0LBW5_QUESU